MELSKVHLRGDKSIFANIAFGHFATNHSHINYYVDLTEIKTSQHAARKAASILAGRYQTTMVETILCLEGTEMLGAFMAEELSQSSLIGINQGQDIHVLTPELNSNNQMIFRENTQHMVKGKSVALFLSSISTGMSVNRALDCLSYYNGRLAGICAGFSAVGDVNGIAVNAVFTQRDIPDYRTYLPENCEICPGTPKIDAIVNNYGFSAL